MSKKGRLALRKRIKFMFDKIKDIVTRDWYYIAVIIILALMCLVMFFSWSKDKNTMRVIDEIEYVDTLMNYRKIYHDKEFKDLKKENRKLYDSLKQYKDKIDYLIQFSYENHHSSGVVHIHDPKPTEGTDLDSALVAETYEYASEPNDTFEYKLRINSDTEPYWYSLDVRTKDEFTIVNKKEEGSDVNDLTIHPSGQGTISDVTTYSRKDKIKLKDRIGFGPSVTCGYDVVNKKFGVMVGVSVTFDITTQWKKKK